MLVALVGLAYWIGVGTNTAANHPTLSWKNGGSSVSESIVVDSNWRWTHIKGETKNCYHGNLWSNKYCPAAATCGKNCILEGVN
jgi:cellulose 1,4-beta-cellobiosidase